MRPGQHNNNKRMRGRNNNNNSSNHNQSNNRGKSPNPLSRVYESNGPDVKIRGTVHHVIEKYMQLGRDAQVSGDRVTAESYYQHAEHYFRVLVAAQQAISPHLVPSIRVDDQPYDEEAEDREGGQRPMEGEASQAGGYQAQGGNQGDERRERQDYQHSDQQRPDQRPDQQRYEGRGRPYQDRNYQNRQPQAGGDNADQPAGEFPVREEGQMSGERRERAPRPERFRREEPRRDERSDVIASPETAVTAAPEPPHENEVVGEGREPGLPSFLTRGRRRGRPAYRRADTEEGGETAEAPAKLPDSESDLPPAK